MLTPETAPASMNRSASAGDAGAFAALRDGIAGLGIGQRVGEVLGGLGNNSSTGSIKVPLPQNDGAASGTGPEQEMRVIS